MSTQQMSASEALDFHHFSVHNAVQAQLACPEASCVAYRDIFTARRWRAQGYAVRNAEQGTAITIWIATPSREDDADDKPIGVVRSASSSSVATRWIGRTSQSPGGDRDRLLCRPGPLLASSKPRATRVVTLRALRDGLRREVAGRSSGVRRGRSHCVASLT